MTSTTTCNCSSAHVKKVRTSALSVFGEGTAWLAARPGGIYLAGHGFHFATFDDALIYAVGGASESDGGVVVHVEPVNLDESEPEL